MRSTTPQVIVKKTSPGIVILPHCDARRVLEVYQDKYEQVGQDDQGRNRQQEEQEQETWCFAVPDFETEKSSCQFVISPMHYACFLK